MKEMRFNIGKEFCVSCSMALKRFIGHMNGVEEVTSEDGRLVIRYNGEQVDETDIFKISSDSLEKLGYKAERE